MTDNDDDTFKDADAAMQADVDANPELYEALAGNHTDADETAIRPPRMTNDRDTPYPITIREARYSGTYAGGPWVLLAGIGRPGACEAFGSDNPCQDFWNARREHGPEFENPEDWGRDYAYAAAGEDPNDLLADLLDYYGDEQ